MERHNRGHIVAIASSAGIMGSPYFTAYGYSSLSPFHWIYLFDLLGQANTVWSDSCVVCMRKWTTILRSNWPQSVHLESVAPESIFQPKHAIPVYFRSWHLNLLSTIFSNQFSKRKSWWYCLGLSNGSTGSLGKFCQLSLKLIQDIYFDTQYFSTKYRQFHLEMFRLRSGAHGRLRSHWPCSLLWSTEPEILHRILSQSKWNFEPDVKIQPRS